MPEPAAANRLLEQLRAALGAAHVLTGDADVEPYVVDWRRRYRGRALAVACPAGVDEVRAALRLAAEARIPVVPQGGNTGLVGGAVPSASGSELVLSLRRLARVRAIDPDNATMTVEAGVTLAAAQEAARAGGFLFPLSLAAEGSCTIGGNLSTNAGGTAVLRFGNTRELVLGVEVVLADGTLWDGLRGLRKDNTGYDLKQVFIGAEGTLGVITAAVLKLFPLPRSSCTALAALSEARGTVALLRALRDSLGDRLTGFEVMHADCIRLVERHIPQQRNPLAGHAWYCLVQADESAADESLGERLQAALCGSAAVADAVVAQSEAQARALWALRSNISEAERLEGYSVKHDVSLPVGAFERFLERAGRGIAAALPGARIVAFGHLGDGNLHYNVAAPVGADSAEFVARASETANRLVHDLVSELGGSISAEHGIGQLKRDEIRRYKSAAELELMRRIKRALDPDNRMNPGKLL